MAMHVATTQGEVELRADGNDVGYDIRLRADMETRFEKPLLSATHPWRGCSNRVSMSARNLISDPTSLQSARNSTSPCVAATYIAIKISNQATQFL